MLRLNERPADVVIPDESHPQRQSRLFREADGRVVGTTLRHSDYAGLARSLGAHGERVEKPSAMEGALRRALKNAPALVDVVTSQSVLSTDAQKGLGFVPDFQALTAWDDAERKRREPR